MKHPNISKKDRFVSAIDLLTISTPDKDRLLSQLRLDWAAIVGQEKIFRWIDKSDEEQCEWIWRELSEKRIFVFLDPDMTSPVRPGDCYYSFFATLDRSSLHPAEKEVLLGKMQKKWVRLKQKKKKVQANFQLSPKVKLWVEEMADDEGLRKSEFMEKLISDTYAKFRKRGAG